MTGWRSPGDLGLYRTPSPSRGNGRPRTRINLRGLGLSEIGEHESDRKKIGVFFPPLPEIATHRTSQRFSSGGDFLAEPGEWHSWDVAGKTV
jgi:hypothetical protein